MVRSAQLDNQWTVDTIAVDSNEGSTKSKSTKETRCVVAIPGTQRSGSEEHEPRTWWCFVSPHEAFITPASHTAPTLLMHTDEHGLCDR